jgi:hypothetical protein
MVLWRINQQHIIQTRILLIYIELNRARSSHEDMLALSDMKGFFNAINILHRHTAQIKNKLHISWETIHIQIQNIKHRSYVKKDS